jgi:hypothetical protein
MKKVKSLVLLISTAFCMCSFFGNATVDATEVNYGDINNDGVVSLLDSVCLNKYLAGRCELYNFNSADLNCDSVIEIVDKEIFSQ